MIKALRRCVITASKIKLLRYFRTIKLHLIRCTQGAISTKSRTSGPQRRSLKTITAPIEMRGYPGNARHQAGTRAHTCGSQLHPMRRAAGGAGNPTRAESSAHVLGPPLPLRERFRRAQRHSAGHRQRHLRPRGCRPPPGGPGSRDGKEGAETAVLSRSEDGRGLGTAPP